MFYQEGNYCYCRPDCYDGDFVQVGRLTLQVEFDYEGNAYVTAPNTGQTYILVD